MKHVRASGFPCPENLIHLFIGGSELHGAKVGSTDDLDIYGVYIESPVLRLGIDTFPHFVWSTAGNERRNGPDDVDLTLYSFAKLAALMAKGNPTALHFLMAPNLSGRDEPWETTIRPRRALFAARAAADKFRGFANAQLRRLKGEGTGKHGQRPEYIGKHGYDTKAAMHIIRLLNEGIEFMRTGQITLPRPEPELSTLISIRTGEFGPLERVLELASQKFDELASAETNSSLPAEVDRGAINRLVAQTYLGFYAQG
ncbi:MAG TPA: nucleotidyltransferase domain-containing protein [Terriglobales bacterium]|nr:nucleotidyltransferase domain-containing protein [Terriglobales bacterium]